MKKFEKTVVFKWVSKNEQKNLRSLIHPQNKNKTITVELFGEGQ